MKQKQTKIKFFEHTHQILPLLKSEKYQNLMKDAIRIFTKEEPDDNRPWASYPSIDEYAEYLFNEDEKYIQKLIENGELDESWNTVDPAKDEDEDMQRVSERRSEIVENAPHNREWFNDINAYCFHYMAFAFAPTVGYELAKDLFPNEDWYVKEVRYYVNDMECLNLGHAIIVNKNETIFFDCVLREDEFTMDDLSDILNGNCPSCDSTHRFRVVKYKPE